MSRSNVVTPMPQHWCPPPPSCPPPVPPGDCGCGCDQPPFGAWGTQLRDCWQQIEQLKCIIKQIMDEVGGPIKTGPILGVVDGSNAAAGDVGEFITGSATFNYAAYPADSTGVVSPIVVQPGDWDLWGSLLCSNVTAGAAFSPSMAVTGLQGNLGGNNRIAGLTQSEVVDIPSGYARGNFTVPTLIPFGITVWMDEATNGPAGTATLNIYGRRRR